MTNVESLCGAFWESRKLLTESNRTHSGKQVMQFSCYAGVDWMFGENSKCVFFFLTAMVFSELVT